MQSGSAATQYQPLRLSRFLSMLSKFLAQADSCLNSHNFRYANPDDQEYASTGTCLVCS
ncbi:hypothetical protein JMJ77_0014327, partial [Colletotrichum scovillei]